MKVILLQDVAKIGKRFSVADVPDGYALNQLIPKKMAEPATPNNLKRINQQQAARAADKEAGAERFAAAAEALSKETIRVAAEANEQSHLFQAIHAADIAAAAKVAGIDIDSGMIEIPAPIKSLGSHEVVLTAGGKHHRFMVEVITK